MQCAPLGAGRGSPSGEDLEASRFLQLRQGRIASGRGRLRPRLFSRLVWPALPVLAVLGIAAGGRASAWKQHTPLSDPRSEVAVATVGGDIVVVGGFIADGNNSSRVDAYSVAD